MAGNIIDMGNGKYRLRVSNSFDINGKRKYYNKTVSCSSMREAEKELGMKSYQVCLIMLRDGI